MTLPLDNTQGNIDRAWLARSAAELARAGVYIGTSSWKYPGWRGQIYTEDRYVWRGRFSEKRFEQACLAEYAEVFRTVCVDAAYYKFPEERFLDGLAQQVPEDFRFAFKVTDEITVKRFPNLPRFGPRAGAVNDRFLDPDVFEAGFLKPCALIRDKVGLLIFEFSRFHRSDYEQGREFVADLDRFLGALPTGWPYGVEIRNRQFLHPEYFSVLARHGVTHVFNSWQAMPPVGEQWRMPGALTNPACVGARFLLKPGRAYQEAVDQFSPYSEVREPLPEAREAGATLIQEGTGNAPARKTFIYVNNRLEGSALGTITAMIQQANGLPV